MTLKHFIFIGLWIVPFLVCNHQAVYSQEPLDEMSLSITQDATGNFRGGIKPGFAQLGLIQLDLTLDTENMEWWDDGTWKVQVQNTYGHRPTDELVGDVQVFSNIEHGNYTYLYQFWYRHHFEDLTLLAGKHDMNALFFTSDYAGQYINSSFGIMPVASLNVPVSIFPSTTLGLVANYRLTQGLSFQGGIYNGYPGKITRTNFGTDLNLSLSRGLFYIGELVWNKSWKDLEGTYKLGAFYHGGSFPTLCNPDITHQGATGAYLLADQVIYQDGNGNAELGTFFQAGYSPDPCSLNDFYMAYGLNFSGLGGSHPGNSLGIALAHASTNDRLMEEENAESYQQCETAVELTYTHHLTDQLVVQPDIQYILNPGMQTRHDNCLVALMRVKWNYN